MWHTTCHRKHQTDPAGGKQREEKERLEGSSVILDMSGSTEVPSPTRSRWGVTCSTDPPLLPLAPDSFSRSSFRRLGVLKLCFSLRPAPPPSSRWVVGRRERWRRMTEGGGIRGRSKLQYSTYVSGCVRRSEDWSGSRSRDSRDVKLCGGTVIRIPLLSGYTGKWFCSLLLMFPNP